MFVTLMKRLFYPVWSVICFGIETILGKRKRDTVMEIQMNGYEDQDQNQMNGYEDQDQNDSVITTPKRLETHKTIKINIKDILNNVEAGSKINEIVNYMHLLRMLTTHLLKLFILKQKFQGKKIKIKNYINESFIIILMEAISSNKNEISGLRVSSRPRKLPKLLEIYSVNFNDADDSSSLSDEFLDKDDTRKLLLNFIQDEDLNDEEIMLNGFDITKLQNTVSKIAQEIVTSYEQNIISNYKKYIERYVNVFYLGGKSGELDSIERGGGTKEEKKKSKSLILHKFRKLKDDLVEPNRRNYKSTDAAALQFLNDHKNLLFPKSRLVIIILLFYYILYLLFIIYD